MPTQLKKEELAEDFRACVQKTIEEYCQVVFAKDAKVVARDIIEYESRMRVFGLEKFNDTCFIAFINLYESPLELERKDTCGVILVYVNEESAERLFKFPLKGHQEEDDTYLMELTKTLCRQLFERFKVSAFRYGYANLLGAEVEGYRSNVEEGVVFPYSQDTLYQVSCNLWKEKMVVAELVLAPASRS
jgi:hypothetical protein